MLCDRSLPFFHIYIFINHIMVAQQRKYNLKNSFCHSVNRITDERGNGRRPNMAGTGKRWPARSGWLLVVITDPDLRVDSGFFHFLHHWRIIFRHLLAFLCFLSSHTINSQFERNLAKWMTLTSVSTILTDIRIQINPNSNPDHFFSNFGVGGGLHSLLQTKHF